MKGNFVKIFFTGHSPERFINLCRNSKIQLWDIHQRNDGYECCLFVNEFYKIKPFVKKARIHVKIIERHGGVFFYTRYRKRRLFFVGSIFTLMMVYYLTSFIWQIEINGNNKITDDVLYDYLEMKNVKHGMKRKNVVCEEICSLLRKDFQEIIWVSTSLEGTMLRITIKEGVEMDKELVSDEKKQNIYSKMNGIIDSIITRKGIPVVKEGDEIKEGDLLVTGTIEIKNDAGDVIRTEQVIPDSDIVIRRNISFEAYCADQHKAQIYFHTKKQRINIYLFGYKVTLGLRKIEGIHERNSRFYQTSIGGNFILPFSYEIETSREYEWQEQIYMNEEQKKILENSYEWYVKSLEEQGIKIINEDLIFEREREGIFYRGKMEVLQQVVDFY